MTTVTGDLSNILGVRGDGVVRISAREPYPLGGVVVIDDWDDVPVKAGKFTASVQPGAARFHVIVGSTSHIFEVNVPASGSTTLADMIVNDYPYTPQVVSEVLQAAKGAAASASTAKASENQALVYRNGASSSASAAASSAGAAKTSETNAKASETNAKTSETNAAGSKNAAAASASAAKTSETNAKASETSAAASATQAGNIANSTSWSGDKLTVNGKTSPSLTGPQGPPGTVNNHTHKINDVSGEADLIDSSRNLDTYTTPGAWLQGANAAATTSLSYPVGSAGLLEVVASGAHTYQTYSVYNSGARFYRSRYLSNWGPWREFSAKGHTHTLADITDAPNSHASFSSPSTLVSRDANGNASFSNPTSGPHAATKGYVDAKDAEGKAYANSRPALFSGAGAPPSSIPGAVVGDMWLNTTTMELSRITGV